MEQPDLIAQKAVEWLVLLHSGEMTQAEREAFDRWRAEDEKHEKACITIERLLNAVPQVNELPGVRNVMEEGRGRRQFLRNTMAAVAFVSLGGLLYDQYRPIRGLTADLLTRTGERRTKSLRDGSRLSLDARTALDLSVAPAKRKLRLIQGLIYIEVASSEVPFVIQTQDGIITLNEGNLTVDLYSEVTRVAVLTHTASVLAGNGQETVLAAGQAGIFALGGVEVQRADSSRELSWLNGFVEMDDQPLERLISRLSVYRHGIIRVEPDAAQMRVSGVFPLQNTDRALETLEQTLPVSISYTTDYWVNISMKV